MTMELGMSFVFTESEKEKKLARLRNKGHNIHIFDVT